MFNIFQPTKRDINRTAPPQIHHRSTSQRRDIAPCRHPPHGGNHTFPRASPCGFTLNPVRHGANMAWKTEGFHAKNGKMAMKHVDFEWLLFENAGGGGAGRGCAKYSYVDLDKSIFGLQIFRQLWCRQQHTYLQHETSLKPPRAIYIPIIIACPSFFGLVQFPWFVKAHLKLLTSNIWTQDSGRPLAPLRQR